MTIKMVSLAHCAALSEMLAGVTPAEKHERMLRRYQRQSRDIARARLVAEIRNALEIEAFGRAADLLIVLRATLAQPHDGYASARRRRAPTRLARAKWATNAAYFAEGSSVTDARECVVAQLFVAPMR